MTWTRHKSPNLKQKTNSENSKSLASKLMLNCNLPLDFKVIEAFFIPAALKTPEPKSCYDTVSVFYSARNTNWETTRELFFNFDREQFVTFACRKRPFHFNKRKKKDQYRRGIVLHIVLKVS